MPQCFAPLLFYSFFYFLQWKKKVQDTMKFKAVQHSEMLNVGSSTYVDRSTVNTTTQIICNYQHIIEANITTTCNNKHEKFWRLLFFTASMMFKIYWQTKCVFYFLEAKFIIIAF
jgi:hypothetical protein